MSDAVHDNEQRAHVAAVVRRNVWPAAVAAVLMCYFGFNAPWAFAPGASPFLKASAYLFDYTLQIGGIAMAVLAVWCWLGMITALAVDGVVSLLIGVLFILSGGGMLMYGGVDLNAILIILFGMMFFGSGRHNWRTYRHLARGGRVVAEVYTETFQPPVPPARPVAPAPEPPPGAGSSVPEDDHADQPALEEDDAGAMEPPPEGFLAAMAKKPPSSTPSNDR
jgi:hypothetical protein